jgi:FtsP/CotA-like multicopper oxidase with cupredoxin domain
MKGSSRLLAIVGTVVVLVIAFVVLSPGGDDEPTPTTGASTTAATAATPTSTAPAPPPAETPNLSSIVVRASKPVGGIKKIEVKKGSRVVIEVSSPDTSDEIHLHGYDLKRDLKAGDSVRFMFTAASDGIYEIELEGAGVQIGELVVEP